MCKSVLKMNRTLMVMQNHPYIGEGCANDVCEMWCLIRELEATCTVQKV